MHITNSPDRKHFISRHTNIQRELLEITSLPLTPVHCSDVTATKERATSMKLCVLSVLSSITCIVGPTSVNMCMLYFMTEPIIAMFPADKQVFEGEEVVFRVKVTGFPQPRMTWYHNGEEVVADYSQKLAVDGSLIMPSTDLKHSGVYQLVVINEAGTVERKVNLFVKREGQKCSNMAKKQTFSPIPVEEFGDYVCKCHANNNEDFRDQYSVRLFYTEK